MISKVINTTSKNFSYMFILLKSFCYMELTIYLVLMCKQSINFTNLELLHKFNGRHFSILSRAIVGELLSDPEK